MPAPLAADVEDCQGLQDGQVDEEARGGAGHHHRQEEAQGLADDGISNCTHRAGGIDRQVSKNNLFRMSSCTYEGQLCCL